MIRHGSFSQAPAMRMTARKLALFAPFALAFAASPALAVDAIDGVYIDSGGYVEITVAPCGQARCGKITRIIRRKPGESDRDAHNDNPALRNRPILGLTLLSGLQWRDGAWRGEVYNPEDGETYRTVVRAGADGALEVEGCLGPFCRKRIWPARSG
ncbi:DUF2147 domain-containing protein [Aurantiacibacter xanthus]|uniref:DUF2147 domain-containing protein n=2 Tax=Aurantiacibacter xanthus TaxID=1784712 RepID=A0A3A1P0I6_9SPHN|nr:DUF2147 domain-containing protein [Aurantiacibacter xanthus]